ncbi:uncharacterized protein KIAA1958 isoform X4 [Oncorhynchus nerka]|uniref:uncharacterized protein KIAA1958 isoform X4 n=1 Tax=Oncorhynchus nerka TaxID=8023 RepID=UPI0031B863BD
MEDCLHTSSENLSKLVRWAHSHGTICALIPNLKHLLTEGSHGNLTAMWGCSAGHAYHWPLPATCKTGQKERGGCFQDSRSINSDSLSVQGGASARQSSPGGERFLGRSTKAKGGDSSQTRDSCDFSNCSDDNTEADDNTEEYNNNLFDIVCESSATTDEDGDVDYEPHHRPRKRGPPGGMPGPQRPGSEDRGQGDKSVKKIKQETAEDFYTVPKAQLAAGVGTDSGLASHSVSQSPKPNNSLSHHALPHKPLQLDADCLVGGVSSSLLGHSFPHKPLRGSISSSVSKPSMMSTSSPRHQDLSSVSTQGLSTLPGASSELMEDLLNHGGSEGPLGNLTPSSPSGMNPDLDLLGAETKGEATVGPALCEIERLRALLSVERSRSEQMGETISSLKQDKELLQQELTKKAELICDFLQDQLRPDDISRLVTAGRPTTCPLDPIPSSLLQTISGDLLPYLTSLINSSLTAGYVPPVFKRARVAPLLKNLHSIPPMSTTTDQYPFFLFSPKPLNVPSLASSPAISLRMTFLIQISQVSRLVIQLRLLFSVSRRRSALLKLTLSPLLSSF